MKQNKIQEQKRNFSLSLKQKESLNYILFTNTALEQGEVPKKVYDPLLKIIHPNSILMKVFISAIKILIEFLVISFIVIAIIFILISSIPGEHPAVSGVNSDIQKKAILANEGLDRPIVEQFFKYIGNLFTFKFGKSYVLRPNLQINEFIFQRFFTSFSVGIFSVIASIALAIPLGIWVGKKPGSLRDVVSSFIISIILSVPSIIFALILIFIGTKVGIPFVFDAKDASSYFLPIVALSLTSIVIIMRYIRVDMNNELNSMHAKFAYLKGVSKSRFVWVHALKPSLFPVSTYFPAMFLSTFTGAFFVENIFSIPGAGSTMFEAIMSKDYNVLLFIIVISSIMTIISFLLRDITYVLFDPRLRRGGKK